MTGGLAWAFSLSLAAGFSSSWGDSWMPALNEQSPALKLEARLLEEAESLSSERLKASTEYDAMFVCAEAADKNCCFPKRFGKLPAGLGWYEAARL